MRSDGGLAARLGRAFILQAVYISIAALVGVFAAGAVLQEVLIKQALRDESTYFWGTFGERADPPLPDTRNLTGYLGARGANGPAPAQFLGHEPGFHRLAGLTDLSMIHVSERDGRTLVLLFDGARVIELATYFGLVPLAGVLVVLYVAMWLAYRTSQQALSPVIALARRVERLDPESPDPTAFAPQYLRADADTEIRTLAAAIAAFAERLNAFVERERNFTRDASHELRSPLTVINIAADMLLSEQDLAGPAQKSVHRIKRAARDMEQLTGAFLLLARESDEGLPRQPVCVNDVVAGELERARLLAADRPVAVVSTADCELTVDGAEKVLAVLIGNLLRNAFSYTDSGKVLVHVAADHVLIEDSGIGMNAEAVDQAFEPFFRGQSQRGGHGVGLTIVKRLSDRFNWPVAITSEPGKGTRVVIAFPRGRTAPLDGTAPTRDA